MMDELGPKMLEMQND